MHSRHNRGFTLIELMITLLIVAIVLTFAANSYRGYILEARRAEGMGELLQLADRLERWYSDRQTYAGAAVGDGSDPSHIYPASSENNLYAFTINSADAVTYSISSAPTSTKSQDDDDCGTFTITSLGAKSVSGSTTAKCWK